MEEVLAEYVNENNEIKDISEEIQRDNDEVFEHEEMYADLPANLENPRKVLNSESKCNQTKSIIKKYILNRATQNQLTELDRLKFPGPRYLQSGKALDYRRNWASKV